MERKGDDELGVIARLHAVETKERLDVYKSTYVHPAPRNTAVDVDGICEGRLRAGCDKVSVLAQALGRDQSPACRTEALRALARCAPVGCPVTVSAAIKHLQDNDPNVQLTAVHVLERTSQSGDRNVISCLISQLMGCGIKDPTQPGAFLNGADPQKRSVSHMARRPGDQSFRKAAPHLRIAAVRALASICVDNDLRVAACLAELAEKDVDKTVRQAALNALVALGRVHLSRDVKENVRIQRSFHDMNIKANQHAIWKEGKTMCQVLGAGRHDNLHMDGAGCGRFGALGY